MADDFSADVATTGIVSVGGSVTGRIEPGIRDRDWFAIDFLAGHHYEIRISGSGPVETALSDPDLRGIHDAAGTLLPRSLDDSYGPGRDASILFRAPESGRHFISVGSWSEPLAATSLLTDYRLSVVEVHVLRGGPGNDWLLWQPGAPVVEGGDGRDTLSFIDSVAPVSVYFLNPWPTSGILPGTAAAIVSGTRYHLYDIENITGSRLDDWIGGSTDANTLRGMAGDDVLYGNGGADRIDGGAGRDTARVDDYWNFHGPGATASLLRGRVWSGDAAGTRLIGIENLEGGGGNDVLTGDHKRNLIYGNYGDDTLIGNGGDDHLDGYWGTDTVVFSHASSEYTITRNGIQTIVDHVGGSGADGRDTLGHIEILRFADGDIIL